MGCLSVSLSFSLSPSLSLSLRSSNSRLYLKELLKIHYIALAISDLESYAELHLPRWLTNCTSDSRFGVTLRALQI